MAKNIFDNYCERCKGRAIKFGEYQANRLQSYHQYKEDHPKVKSRSDVKTLVDLCDSQHCIPKIYYGNDGRIKWFYIKNTFDRNIYEVDKDFALHIHIQRAQLFISLCVCGCKEYKRIIVSRVSGVDSRVDGLPEDFVIVENND